jgi:hypothetical protein
MASPVVDLVLIYQFLKRLTTPFTETDAYKLGLIDENGKKIKKPQTREEDRAYGYFDRLVFNIKKLIEQLPGGKSKLASYAAALFLIRESATQKEYTDTEIAQGLYEAMEELEKTTQKNLRNLIEDAPANATGAAVAGTGDDPVHWRRPDARKKEMKAFLRRYMDQKTKREEIKKKQEFLKQMGLR